LACQPGAAPVVLAEIIAAEQLEIDSEIASFPKAASTA
jgi:hypothetical protein